MKSIISNANHCYLCGRKENLHTHHVLYGTANRKKADEDGLTIKLCPSCHTAIHNPTTKFDKWTAKALKEIAQEKWEDRYGSREEFIERYGKNYLAKD